MGHIATEIAPLCCPSVIDLCHRIHFKEKTKIAEERYRQEYKDLNHNEWEQRGLGYIRTSLYQEVQKHKKTSRACKCGQNNDGR